ncbi:creatininase family protein [Streptomyces boninensis]|uniref:creatininase family protein n=1 Tax=Streptomyces boninensis TaxID=2039455 RepID=UPI003B2195DB
MTASHWTDLNRQQLTELLPDALVLLPVGATEQHGPHLQTGTDTLLATTVVQRAAQLAATTRPLVLAPPLPYGCSDHHLPFGGTLSLSPETMLATLLDIARSLQIDGARRLFIINGHGGNIGPCHSAAAAASTRHGLAVAYANYWDLSGTGDSPGHAGAFETSAVASLHPLAAPAPDRPTQPEVPAAAGVTVHTQALWQAIDGYSDTPSARTPEQGAAWLDACAKGLAERIDHLAEALA